MKPALRVLPRIWIGFLPAITTMAQVSHPDQAIPSNEILGRELLIPENQGQEDTIPNRHKIIPFSIYILSIDNKIVKYELKIG